MKKALMAAAALVALPVMAQAQAPSPGVYRRGWRSELASELHGQHQQSGVSDGERDAEDGRCGRWRDRLRLCRPAR